LIHPERDVVSRKSEALMRRTIIVLILSIVSAVLIFVVGGLFNAISGFGFDYSPPYNDPIRVVATLIGSAPGLAVALTALGFALYDASRRGGVIWIIGLLAWPVVPIVEASLMFAGALAFPIYWFLPLVLLPLAPLVYALAAPRAASAAPDSGLAGAAARPRLMVFVGVLSVAVVASAAILVFPLTQAVANTQGSPPALRVSQASATADCANGVYPSVTLTNAGSQTLQWSASSQDSNVVASPPSGSLAPSASTTVTLSGKTSAASVIVQFSAGGVEANVAKFGCGSGGAK
jgi:hypothetical protein